jgi:carbonic anhydrase
MNHHGPIKDLMDGNQRFVRSRKYRKERHGLVNGQNPGAVIVCCSDSRVPPEIVFQKKKLGEIFVVRTAGHVLDLASMESIKFALEYLQCNLVIVLGHEKCGAVSAVYDSIVYDRADQHDHKQFQAIERYIEMSIQNDPNLSREDNIDQSIKANAIRTAHYIIDNTDIDPFCIHAAYYHIKSGQVMNLDDWS